MPSLLKEPKKSGNFCHSCKLKIFFYRTAVGEVVKNVCNFSHHMADLVIHGKATSNSAPIDQGEGR